LGYKEYEKKYSGQKWWEETKHRMQNKTEEKKDLDRKLVQEIGDANKLKKPIQLSEIKKLVKQGAQIDHWVADGVYADRYNAVQLAAKNRSDEATEALVYLIKHFNFIQTDPGEFCYSPLGMSISLGHSKMATEIIKMKVSKNPIYSFLRWANRQTTKDGKTKILEEIRQNYNFSKILKDDLKQIKDQKEFGYTNIQSNLLTLFNFCKSKNVNLEECFGKSYSIGNPIAWRFKSGNKNHWVAEETQKTFKVGKVSIENCRNKIKVCFDFILRFIIYVLDHRFPRVKCLQPIKQRPIRSRFCQISSVENSCRSKNRN